MAGSSALRSECGGNSVICAFNAPYVELQPWAPLQMRVFHLVTTSCPWVGEQTRRLMFCSVYTGVDAARGSDTGAPAEGAHVVRERGLPQWVRLPIHSTLPHMHVQGRTGS